MQGNPLLTKKTSVPGPACWSHPTKDLVPASADLTGEQHTGSGRNRVGVNLGHYNVIQALDLSIQVRDAGEMDMATADSSTAKTSDTALRNLPCA